MSVEIEIKYERGQRTKAHHGPSGSTLQTDAPVDNGGTGKAFAPTDLVATALGSCILTIVGKVASCSLATLLTGYGIDTSLRVGLGLAQIGEFSFIIARLGEATQVTSAFLYPIAVSVSSLTTLTTPLLMRQADRVVELSMKLNRLGKAPKDS